MQNEQIEQLLKALPALMTRLQVLSRGPDIGTWNMIIADDDGWDRADIFVAFNPNGTTLTLHTTIATSTHTKVAAVRKLMLAFNSQWGKSGGFGAGMDEEGNAELIADVVVTGLRIQDLAHTLDAFAAQAVELQAKVEKAGNMSFSYVPAAVHDFDPMIDIHAVRV